MSVFSMHNIKLMPYDSMVDIDRSHLQKKRDVIYIEDGLGGV